MLHHRRVGGVVWHFHEDQLESANCLFGEIAKHKQVIFCYGNPCRRHNYFTVYSHGLMTSTPAA
jgi:hypothetical protein